jgi:PKD repeat protein
MPAVLAFVPRCALGLVAALLVAAPAAAMPLDRSLTARAGSGCDPLRAAHRATNCFGAPTADFTVAPGPIVAPGAQVDFDGSTSQTATGGPITDYRWELTGDAQYDDATGSTTSRVYATHGRYDVGLEVVDGQVAAFKNMTLIVTDPPVAQLAAPSPASPLTNESTTFDASASSDPDGDPIATYEWDWGNDGTYDETTSTATNSHSFGSAGSTTVAVRVTDSDGATDTASVTFTVRNRPPVAAFAQPSPAVADRSGTYDAGASADPDGTIVKYEWDWNHDGSYEDTTTAATIAHTFSSSGSKSVGLRVTDDKGDTDLLVQSVDVTAAPTASFTATPNPASLRVPVTFTPTAGDTDGTVVLYEWDFEGDGVWDASDIAANPIAHAYADPGTYPAKLRVTDSDGAETIVTVSVQARNIHPVADFTATPNPVAVGAPVQLDARASSDADGAVVSYDWDLDGNGVFETPGGASPLLTRSFPNPGTIPAGLRVTDDDGDATVKTVSLTIFDPSAPDAVGSGDGAGTAAGAGAAPDAAGSGASALSTGFPGADVARLSAGLSGPAIQKLRGALRGGLRVACVADRPVTCDLAVEITSTSAKRMKLRAARKPIRVGSARVALDRAGSSAVAIKITGRARRALGRARSVQLAVRGVATDAAGHSVRLKRLFLLRR